MAEIRIRGLDDSTKSLIEKRAKEKNESLNKYLCTFLENAFVNFETLNREERFVTAMNHLSDTLKAQIECMNHQSKQLDFIIQLFTDGGD